MRSCLAVGLAIASSVAGIDAAGAAPLAGSVLDGTTVAPISGATVTADNGAKATTDMLGTYRFAELPAGTVELTITALGYERASQTVELPERGLSDVVLTIFRPGATGEIIEMEDTAPREAVQPGKQNLGREELTRIPGARGDALTTLKSLPGVANVDAPGAGPGILVIRGSAPEDSKVTIDGIQVPLLYHFFGLQSILPSEFIDNIEFMPGGFGVEEGRATGGFINVSTRDDAPDTIDGFAELSFINLAAFLHGPISRARNLLFAAGIRRSTIDFILPAVIPDEADINFTTAPQYYDAQMRVDWRPKPRHKLSSLALLSFDLLTLISNEVNPNEPLLTGKFENEIQFFRLINSWKYEAPGFQSRLTSSVGATLFRVEVGPTRFIEIKGRRAELREDAAYKLSSELQLHAGAEARLAGADVDIRFPLPPQEGSGGVPNFSSSPLLERMETTTNHVAGAYLAVDIRPTKSTTISPGVRFDYFHRFGATSTSPRVSVEQQVAKAWKLRGTIGSYSRPVENNEAIATYLKPEIATQYVAGADYQIAPGWAASASTFYTDRRQLVVQDANLAQTDVDNSYVNRGFGRSYGAEALVRAKMSNFFGWIAYTLSRSDRIDSPIAERRLFDFDQTHIFIAVGSYKLGKWTFGGRWQYSTGSPTTPVVGTIFQSDLNIYLPVLGDINSDRLSAAHQFDARIDRTWTFQSWKLSTYVDVTNVYANPRTLGFRYNFDYTERETIKELPIVPAFGVRGSF